MPITLIDPSAERVASIQNGATRLDTLQGKRIALLDNIKHNAEYMLMEVGERLKRDFNCTTELIKKKTYTRFAETHIIESLKKYDGVVTAVGD
jgi:hypothetical protein